MPRTLSKFMAAVAVSALTVAPLAVGISLVSTDAAFAKPGQGNGNGGQGGGRERGGGREKAGNSRGGGAGNGVSGENRGRGAIASELGPLNAAHANQNALENASPGSMPGKLYTYQQTGGITVDEINDYNEARAEKDRLNSLSEEEKLDDYDEDGDGELSDEEAQKFDDDLAAVEETLKEYGDAYTALAGLRDGSLNLSAGALDELNSMLGLDQ